MMRSVCAAEWQLFKYKTQRVYTSTKAVHTIYLKVNVLILQALVRDGKLKFNIPIPNKSI